MRSEFWETIPSKWVVDGIFYWNIKEKFFKFSPQYYTMSGYMPYEFSESYAEWEKRLHPDDIDRVTRRISLYLSGKTKIYNEVFRFLTKAGDWMWIRARINVIESSPDGIPELVIGTHTDVSSEMEAAINLEESDALLNSIVDNCQPIITVVDKDGTIRLPEGKDLEKIGIPHSEHVGKSFFEIFRENEIIVEIANKAISGETICETVKLGERYLDTVISPVKDCQDNITGAVGISIDKTDEIIGMKEKELLQSAVNSAAESIVITNVDGEITYANPAFERMTGYNSNEFLGKNPRILKGKRSDKSFYLDLWSKISSGKTWRGRFYNVDKNGKEFIEDSVISPITAPNGEIISYVAVKKDVTKEVELEEKLRQMEKMESLGMLAGGIAHDFNNILTGIIGYTELAMWSLPEKSPVEPHLIDGLKGCERARTLVQRILAFSRKTQRECTLFDPSELVSEVMDFLRSTIPSTIEIETSVDSFTNGIFWDSNCLHEVLINLCTNASSSIGEHGKIKVNCKPVAVREIQGIIGSIPQGKYAKVDIIDSGEGMSESVLNHIFEPFYTTKDIGKGTGMGLSVVLALLKDHSSDITVTSELGVGTCFTLYLPLSDELLTASDNLLTGRVPRGDERLLVVDDELIIGKMLKSMLSSLGYEVDFFADSVLALEHFKENCEAYDIVITDHVMPSLTGLELIQEVKAIRNDVATMIYYGAGEIDADYLSDKKDVDAFLAKPFNREEFTIELRETLDRNSSK